MSIFDDIRRELAKVERLERIEIAAEELAAVAAEATRETYELTRHIQGAKAIFERRMNVVKAFREATA